MYGINYEKCNWIKWEGWKTVDQRKYALYAK